LSARTVEEKIKDMIETRKELAGALEHVAKKWIPVLRTRTCVVNNLEHAF
jgi:hypothetical protein